MPAGKDGNFIKFLGTAGARFVMARQLRSSAGIYLELDGERIMLDPGPGTLVRCAKARPPIDVTKLDALILSHNHIDHSGDANALIDAMTAGGLEKRGMLFAPGECISGEDRVILAYLRGFLDTIQVLGPGTAYRAGKARFATSVRHEHAAETYGFIFTVGGKKISFMSDTKYFPGLARSYAGSELLVMNVVFFEPLKDVMHLSLDDVRRIVRELSPRKVILTHLGMTMLRARPRELGPRLSDELGVEVAIAYDGMTVPLGKK